MLSHASVSWITQAEVEAATARGETMVTVGQDVRLDNRCLDLRTQANQAIFQIQSAVVQVSRQAGSAVYS